MDCLKNYCDATVWVLPSVCGICGLLRGQVVEVDINNACPPPLNFSILCVKDPLLTDESLSCMVYVSLMAQSLNSIH